MAEDKSKLEGGLKNIYFAKISEIENVPFDENSSKRWYAIPIYENEKQNSDGETFACLASMFFPTPTDPVWKQLGFKSEQDFSDSQHFVNDSGYCMSHQRDYKMCKELLKLKDHE